MKEMRFLASDDVIFAATGERVDADTTVYIAIGTDPDKLRIHELDLTQDNADRLRKELGQWIDAAHEPGAISTEPVRSSRNRGQNAATHDYYRRMRAWADRTGREKLYHPLEKGGWYYSPTLRREFAEHLRALAANPTYESEADL